MASDNFWNDLPFPSGSNITQATPQYCKGDFPHVFMGDGKEDFSDVLKCR